MKRVASPGLMHDTGCLGLVHWDDPEGWYGEGKNNLGTENPGGKYRRIAGGNMKTFCIGILRPVFTHWLKEW